MFSLIVVVGFLIGATLFRRGAPWGVVFAATLLVALGGLDIVLLSAQLPAIHFGIAAGAPGLELSHVLLAIALVCIWSGSGRTAGLGVLFAFLPIALVLFLTAWGREPQQLAGLILMTTALLAFGLGSWLATRTDPASQSLLAAAAAGICVLQTLAAVAQSQGLLLFGSTGTDTASYIADEGRMVGLYNHPSTLGKTTFLLLAILLPLSASKTRSVRLSAQIGIAAGVVGTLLTLSRANAVATTATLLIWVLINRRDVSVGARIGTAFLFVGAALANLGAIGAILARNASDPAGGQRSELTRIGLAQIQESPWVGVGVNYYSEYVGAVDRYAALGFPVHNAFLLGAAELGIPLAAVFFLPLAIASVSTYRRWRRQGHLDSRSAAFVSMIPGTLAITLTGWGLLAESSLPLWFLALGYLTDARRGSSASADEGREAENRSRGGTVLTRTPSPGPSRAAKPPTSLE